MSTSLKPTTAKEVSRDNNFNALRLLLATLVIFSHSFPIARGIQCFDPFKDMLHSQYDQPGDHAIDGGHLAVYGFFVISGYLVTMSFCRSRSLGDYFRKRVLRIYPGFVVAVGLCCFLFGPLGATRASDYWRALAHSLPHIVFALLNLNQIDFLKPFQSTFTSNPLPSLVDGSMWTIHYEFVCYVMVAVAGMMGMAARFLPVFLRRLFPALFFLFVYGLYAGNLDGHFLGWAGVINSSHLLSHLTGATNNIPRLFVYFAAGMTLYAYRHWVRYHTWGLMVALVVLAVSAWNPPLLPLTLPLFGAYALLAIAFAPWPPLSKFGTKTDLSYGVYLYAFPVQQLLILFVGRHLSPYTLFLAALPPTFLLAWLSWTIIERPALQRKGATAHRLQPIQSKLLLHLTAPHDTAVSCPASSEAAP